MCGLREKAEVLLAVGLAAALAAVDVVTGVISRAWDATEEDLTVGQRWDDEVIHGDHGDTRIKGAPGSSWSYDGEGLEG